MSPSKFKSPASAKNDDLNTRQFMARMNAKLAKVSVLASAGCISMGLAIWSLVPLKQTIPYVVTVNQDTGEVTAASNQQASQFKPSQKTIDFFLRRWVSDLFTINQYTTVNITDPRAQRFIRGENAITEYKDFRSKDQTFVKLADDPAYTRNAEVESLTPIAGTDNGVIAQVNLTTFSNGKKSTSTAILTLYYIILPTNDIQSLQLNPISLYIIDFKVSEK